MRTRSQSALWSWPRGAAAFSLLTLLAAAPGIAQRMMPAATAGSDQIVAIAGEADFEQRYAIIPTPFGLDRGRCDRVTLAETLSGSTPSSEALGGGVPIASRTAGDLVGSGMAPVMDTVDQQCVGQVLEYTPDQRTVTWRRQDTGYAVTPEMTYRSAKGSYCRTFRVTVTSADQPRAVELNACRNADGRWSTVN
ncbi:MAG: hypothetical protein CMM50_06430 [Rhodospirillaceae bacterium]|nr:hypothetical protein [Rhodospirillaceae bacterium]